MRKEFESKKGYKVAGKFVRKKALVCKKVFESREGDEMAKSAIYTFRARRSVQRSPQI